MFNRKPTVMRTRRYSKLIRFAIIAAVIVLASCLIAYGWQKYEEEKYPDGTDANYSLPNAFLNFAQLVTDFFSQDRKENEDLSSLGSDEGESREDNTVTEIIVGGNDSGPSEESEPDSEAEPVIKGGIVPETDAAAESSLSTSVFVGDYFVYYADYIGYCDYALPVYATGYDLNSLLSKKVMRLEGEEVTLTDYIASIKGARAVYIMLSAESISWMDYPTFVKKYTTLLDGIISVQPDADIYIQSILPINTEEASKRGYSVTNEKINQINEYFASIAEEKEVWYLDAASAFKDGSGELPDEMTTNGIRLSDEAYAAWYEYILKHKAH
ncbi:MAG: GDSL-type esterase/lipase family protein [Oscillospiraceae bacterium]